MRARFGQLMSRQQLFKQLLWRDAWNSSLKSPRPEKPAVRFAGAGGFSPSLANLRPPPHRRGSTLRDSRPDSAAIQRLAPLAWQTPRGPADLGAGEATRLAGSRHYATAGQTGKAYFDPPGSTGPEPPHRRNSDNRCRS